MSRKIAFATDEFYHLYNRGTEKRNIFSTKAEYERFLILLYVANSTLPFHLDDILKHISRGSTSRLSVLDEFDRGETLTEISAYCLMPNHFHLLVRGRKDGDISKFMQKLSTGYTMYFNTSHNRTGSLFQGKFKATHITNDRYLAYLVSYIHLNPIKLIEPKWKETGITNRTDALHYLEKYQYSSFIDYLGKTRVQSKIINKSVLPAYCESALQYKHAVQEWLTYSDQNT